VEYSTGGKIGPTLDVSGNGDRDLRLICGGGVPDFALRAIFDETGDVIGDKLSADGLVIREGIDIILGV